jgi:hypothetical protein
MPIQTTSFPTNTPFFQSYAPYTLPSNKVPADVVGDMVSINLVPVEEPTVVTYSVGAEHSYEVLAIIKNISENTTLDITANFTNPALFVYYPSDLSFSLAPLEVKKFKVSINKDFLNSIGNRQPISTILTITVINKNNNSLIIRDITVEKISPEIIPPSIEIF